MILLIIGSSTDPSFFHVGCRPSHHVGLRPALTSDLLVRKACLALTSDHIGTNLIITSERPALTFSYAGTHPATMLKRLCTSTHAGTHPATMMERLSTPG